ncbi:hypothetical protein RISK_005677 [Rhodopirellula islandica]|uniref:Uncharacterized protein n=1 Tax=Rhodopirellula islandica TaxID=595434 RepID=A0A0J1B826_RHOIS|nr:hypothetical protein RISK_005677 [Rhodopirellula islandica]
MKKESRYARQSRVFPPNPAQNVPWAAANLGNRFSDPSCK